MKDAILPTWGHSVGHSAGFWLLLIGWCVLTYQGKGSSIGIAGLAATCIWIWAMLDPRVLVSQQVATRYVLLARQRCDGCVTIGSNRMYGGVRCVWWVGSLFWMWGQLTQPDLEDQLRRDRRAESSASCRCFFSKMGDAVLRPLQSAAWKWFY